MSNRTLSSPTRTMSNHSIMSSRSTMPSRTPSPNSNISPSRAVMNASETCAVRRLSARQIAALVLLLGVSLPGGAAASEEFPTELRAVANLECTPACSVCHQQDPGTSRTATKEFAVAMQKAGLTGTKPETLAPAYESLDPEGDRIVVYRDSSDAEVEFNLAEAPCQAEIDYGCSVAESKPKKGGSAGWWTPFLLSALGLGVYARRRLVR